MKVKVCQLCDNAFRCYEDESSCWCDMMIPLKAEDLRKMQTADCVCPPCLRAKAKANELGEFNDIP